MTVNKTTRDDQEARNSRRAELFCWRCDGSRLHDNIAYVRDTNPDDPMSGMMTRARCTVCGAWKATTD